MSRYAQLDGLGGIVNVIEWDGHTPLALPAGHSLRPAGPADQSPTPAVSVNQATITNNLAVRLAQLEAWAAANPGGAALTAAQTAALVRSVAGLARLALNLLDTTGQA